MGMSFGKIVSSFSGTGKSYIGERYTNVADLDLGDYKFIYDECKGIPYESRKAMKQYRINPEFPNNYIQAVMHAREKHDLVLITFCTEIEEFLAQNGIDFYYFMPSEHAWQILETRFKERGNPQRFIDIVKSRFEHDIKITKPNHIHIKMDDEEFLEGVLKKRGWL